MGAVSKHRRQAIALLAATFFLLVAASFHSSDDNDIASLGSARQTAGVSRPAAPDTCSACALDGIVLARLSLALPVGRPESIAPLTFPNLPAPFVSPRASVESRPPPSIA